ncbi:MAG: rhomboid family intramembrane serine protease [Actinobacteria bacterium]|nr:MAG: rhomboid family intramembrane serine protease [Actinomycetota bacterium]
MIPLKDENPTEQFAWVNTALIAINIAIFIYELTLGARLTPFIMRYGYTPAAFLANPFSLAAISTVFTSMFLHAGFIHVGGNMLYLFIFGNNIEDLLGHWRYTLFYFLCGIGALAGHTISDPRSSIVSIGASGAIAGILGAYIVLYPRARVLTVIPIFFFIQLAQLPAILVIGFWLLLQFISGFTALTSQTAQTGGVAWFAHIGGFATGLALIFLIPHRRPRPLPKEPREW